VKRFHILDAMKVLLALIIVLLNYNICFAQTKTDALFEKLDSINEKRNKIANEKFHAIDQFKIQLGRVPAERQYPLLDSLYNEYKSFIYDSAFSYALRLQHIAYRTKDPVKIVDAKMKIGFVLVSSGLLNEALDTLKSVKLNGLGRMIRSDYYYLMVRTCFDLADFAQNQFYGEMYSRMAEIYADSAIALLPGQAPEYLIVKGLKSLHLNKMDEAREYYENLIAHYSLTDHQFAIAASTLSYIYSLSGELDKSKQMLILAAISDTKSNTKEAIALVKLADLLYREGNIEKAYQYIKLGMEDADFYGARYRKMQVATILPIIETERFSRLESRRKMLMLYSLIITISVIMLVIVFYTINKQYRKLKKAEHAISAANHQLQESNKIKEEYLWYYFNSTADYINKLDALKSIIELKVSTKKIEDLRGTAENINIKRERNELFHNFDKVFLKLFPNFVNAFNALLAEENKMMLKPDQLLNVEMRIFALIRLGIHDHEKIAKILGYSLTTIYTYKTRVKAKAIVSSEEFDHRILSISTL
jgi:DNA-binding CsgD family transcriptional regulator